MSCFKRRFVNFGKMLLQFEVGTGSYVGTRGPITEKIQTAFFDIVNGRNPKYAEWLTLVA